MPIMSSLTHANVALTDSQIKSPSLPFTSSYNLPSSLTNQGADYPEDYLSKLSCSVTMRQSIISTARNEGGIDEVLVSALGSISMRSGHAEERTKPNRLKPLTMTHEQKSRRILQHCSSWTQLDDTRANRGIVHGQGKNLSLIHI